MYVYTYHIKSYRIIYRGRVNDYQMVDQGISNYYST